MDLQVGGGVGGRVGGRVGMSGRWMRGEVMEGDGGGNKGRK